MDAMVMAYGFLAYLELELHCYTCRSCKAAVFGRREGFCDKHTEIMRQLKLAVNQLPTDLRERAELLMLNIIEESTK